VKKQGKLEVRWEVVDGYVGKSRPQHTYIPFTEFEEDMSEGDIINLIEQWVEEDFHQNFSADIMNDDECVRVVQALQARRGDVEEEAV
jgi:hypothetical protein